MPRDTFLNLADNKRKLFLKEAYKEFSLNNFEGASITNLVKSLGIAKGKEGSPGSAGSGRGMPADFRDVIHTLFAEHAMVKRKVKVTQDGYEAETTSADAEMVTLLQTHVAQMKSRLESGMGVRHWDPAFAEIRAHYEDMDIEIEDIEKGVRVKVEGKTPEAVKVAQNHANILSGFVERGPVEGMVHL